MEINYIADGQNINIKTRNKILLGVRCILFRPKVFVKNREEKGIIP